MSNQRSTGNVSTCHICVYIVRNSFGAALLHRTPDSSDWDASTLRYYDPSGLSSYNSVGNALLSLYQATPVAHSSN